MIKSINLEITNICNLKCSICDIWKNKNWSFLDEKNINNILSSKYINKDLDITITWWEPFLNTDINNIVKSINTLWFKVNTISTNWTFYNKLEKLLSFCNTNNFILPNIHISIDWLEDKHELQRWVKWSFRQSINTIIKLKKRFKDINIKIKYTITKNNISDIKKVYILSKRLLVDISFKIVENDEFYTNRISKTNLIDNDKKNDIVNILKSIYKNNDYINNLIFYIQNDKLNFKCTTPSDNLFIMADWETYCCTKYKSIWNIKKEKIDNIINNLSHMDIISTVDNINCSKCFSLHWSYNILK